MTLPSGFTPAPLATVTLAVNVTVVPRVVVLPLTDEVRVVVEAASTSTVMVPSPGRKFAFLEAVNVASMACVPTDKGLVVVKVATEVLFPAALRLMDAGTVAAPSMVKATVPVGVALGEVTDALKVTFCP